MILHSVHLTWAPGVTDADVQDLTKALREMATKIPELRSYRCGPALGLRPGADFVVAALVDDADALAAYLDSDVHLAVYDERRSRMVAGRTAAQLTVADSASL